MSVYEGVNDIIAQGQRNVNGIIENHLERRKDGSKAVAAEWGEDEVMTSTIVQLKKLFKVIANSGLKFVLVLKARPTDAVLKTLLDELRTQIDMLLAHYMNFVAQSCSECLFDSWSRAVATFLRHTNDLLQAAQAQNAQALNYMVGMVDKISDEAQKLPESNKMAYRLQFVEQCVLVKETVQEFKGYLEEAAEKARAALEDGMAKASLTEAAGDGADNNGDEDDGSEEGDEDDGDGELDYTAKEVQVVEAAVKLLGKTLGSIKHSLQVCTRVCDSASAQQTSGTPTTVFTSEAVAEAAAVRQCSQQWVAELSRLAQELRKDVLDLGAELYPPFEADCSAIVERFGLLKERCIGYLKLLDTESLRALQATEDVARTANLLSEVQDCGLPLKA